MPTFSNPLHPFLSVLSPLPQFISSWVFPSFFHPGAGQMLIS
jgi:hypothetical protein